LTSDALPTTSPRDGDASGGGGPGALARRLARHMRRVLLGKDETIRLTLAALFADGHLLIEDVPGVGKTMLARSLARSLDAQFARIQMTPDLLPSDISGISVFNEGTREFEFRPGPVFTQILLADELNRATPRAQAALLESMAERTVTADGKTRLLDELFLVLATQNPLEQHGVYALPEAQLDRFLMKLSVGYPDLDTEVAMLDAQRDRHPIEALEPIASREDVLTARAGVRRVHVDPDISRYIVQIVDATRHHEDVLLGGSPRASISLYRVARALAWMDGRDYVSPDAVKEAAKPVLAHRLALRPQARISGLNPEAVVEDVLRDTPAPIGE
jgi:MoxR-like ATPase